MMPATLRAGDAGRLGNGSSLHARLWVEAFALRVTVPLLLRLWPLDRVLRALSVEGARVIEGMTERELLASVEHVTDLITRHLRPTRTACLQRALVRYALLRRHGVAPRFVIGVRPGGEVGFEAHAFLTLAGSQVMERDEVAYRAAFEWPPAGG
jgi:hypothetical protein